MTSYRPFLGLTSLMIPALFCGGCGKQSTTMEPTKLRSFAALPEAPASGANDRHGSQNRSGPNALL